MDETRDFKITDHRVFADGTLNDLPEEEIPIPKSELSIKEQVEQRPLSVKLREEKEKKSNKKEIRLIKKTEKQEAKTKQQSKILQCPLCKYKGKDNEFLHNIKAAFSVCTKCGIVFLPIGHVRSLMKIATAGNRGIIISGK